MNIGSLYATLNLDDRQFAAALERSTRRSRSFVSSFQQAFATVAGPTLLIGGIQRATSAALSFAKAIKDNAEATGLSRSEYVALDYLFRQNGASGDQLVSTIAKLRGAIADAAGGSKSARENFEKIGVSWQTLIYKNPYQQLRAVAQAMRDSGEGTIAFAAAADVLGARNLPRLNAGLRELATTDPTKILPGAERIAAAAARVEELGQGIENFGEGAKAAATLGLAALLTKLDQLKAYADDPNNFLNRFDRWFSNLGSARVSSQAFDQLIAQRAILQAAADEDAAAARAAWAAHDDAIRRARYGAMRRAPGAGRSGAISSALQDKLEARQRSSALQAQRDALEDQLALVRKEQEIFQRGLSFTAANDPFIALSESIREANGALASGVVTATAYKNAIESAATAFGAAGLQQIQNQGALAGLAGQRGKAKTFSRTEAYARKLAAQGKFEEAANQLNYLKSQDQALGTQLETAMGLGAVGPAGIQAGKTATRAKSLEDRVDSLTKAIEEVAKKLTVS